MSLPTPNLDDRDWQTLVDDAKRRIAAKCPGWTDFNPSDPGMALVDVMAWMTETVLYRLNRVPDLNYIKFLDLIGVRLQPARAARAWLFFTVQKGSDEARLKTVTKGARVATRPQAGAEPVSFATTETLHLTSRRIIKTASMYAPNPGEGGTRAAVELEEIHHLTSGFPQETEIFHLGGALSPGEAATVPHSLYLGDPDLAAFGLQTEVEIRIESVGPAQAPCFLQWSAWDGQSWQNVTVEDGTAGLQQTGVIRCKTLPSLGKCPPDKLRPPLGVGNQPQATPAKPPAGWLRASLVGSEAESLPRLTSISRRVSSKGCIASPGKAYSRAPLDQPPPLPQAGQPDPPPPTWLPVDTTAPFAPFGLRAREGSIFCFASDLFQRSGDTITVRFRLDLPLPAQSGIEIDWEYPTQDNEWHPLGKSTSERADPTGDGFADGTLACTQDGELTFTCPADIAQTEVANVRGWFIRARLEKFQGAATAIVEAHPPAAAADSWQLIVHSLLLGVTGSDRPWQHCLSENYGRVQDRAATEEFEPFELQANQDPAFYLCFDGRPEVERGPYRIYLDVVPHKVDPGASDMVWQRDASGWNWQPATPTLELTAPRLRWEYCVPAAEGDQGPGNWRPLRIVRDGTEAFTRPGVIEFFSSEDWAACRYFQQDGYWLRVRWQLAEYLRPPRLRRVALNGVEVKQSTSAQRILGSSDASPNQCFSLHFSVLDYPEIWVREDDLTDAEISDLQTVASGSDLSTETRIAHEKDGWWVRWEETLNFHASASRDHEKVRHFRAELETGSFFFGDGQFGAIPPAGRSNIRVVYRITQGARGNAGADTINVLESAEPDVAAVVNHDAAQGGCDPEEIERAKLRGPWEITHGDRAVTRQDFEALALKASQLVGKAFCREDGGVIRVVIVPRDAGLAPRPGQRLLDQVRAYLEPRRMINTRLSVEAPFYQLIEVKIKLVLRSTFDGEFRDVAAAVVQALTRFIHPIFGSDDHDGWEMGGAVHKSALYYLIEQNPAVKYVDDLEIRRPGGQAEDRIAIEPNTFPCFKQQMEIERV